MEEMDQLGQRPSNFTARQLPTSTSALKSSAIPEAHNIHHTEKEACVTDLVLLQEAVAHIPHTSVTLGQARCDNTWNQAAFLSAYLPPHYHPR